MYTADNPKGEKLKTDGLANIDESFIAHMQIKAIDAVAGNNDAILALTSLSAAAQTITTNINSPTIPRNLRIVGNATGIVGNVTVKGTNYSGDNISESLVLNGTTVVEGLKAFASIAEIDLPIQTNASGDEISVGFGEKIGIPYKLFHDTILAAYLDNIKESTAPTVTTDSENLENNTVKLNSSLEGTIVDVYLLV